MYKQYLESFHLLTPADEERFLRTLKRTCYNGVYPYKLFPKKELEDIEFEPITIFYGGNGSGKSTLLNVIAEKLGAVRHSAFGLQKELAKYISDSASHFGCQFILASHSPILLSMPDVLIYDLDEVPVCTKRWREA